RFSTGTFNLLPCAFGEVTWDDPKPYVIYGFLFVDNCTWNIAAGTEIYVHGDLVNADGTIYQDGRITVLSNGTVNAAGTLEDPIVIQGDRLEENFADVAGQWSGFVIDDLSSGNTFEHTIIKNSTIGVFVDSAAELSLRNSQIYNTSSYGIRGRHSRINMENCLLYNNFSSSSAFIDFGGDYEFTYCTFANYGVDANALSISNFFCYVFGDLGNCELGDAYRLNARFTNCIFAGSKRDQISSFDITDGQNPAMFNYRFDNCLVRYDELEENIPRFEQSFQNLTRINSSLDTLFVSTSEDDYRLDSLSLAEGKAVPIPTISSDIEGNMRDAQTPDVGCYEHQD
ncbi:MAG: hypothetical protein AAF738_06455, partial [Bacteroidota bacterium]